MITRKYTYNDVFNMYFDYCNNFLTIERFAEHYSISCDNATFLINFCRTLLGNNLCLNDVVELIDMDQVAFEFKHVLY